jgi:hypothetical protein
MAPLLSLSLSASSSLSRFLDLSSLHRGPPPPRYLSTRLTLSPLRFLSDSCVSLPRRLAYTPIALLPIEKYIILKA